MSTDLARAYDFILRADMAGTRHEPWRYGTAVFLPELPLRLDSNYLLVDPAPAGVTARELADESDRVLADLPLRCLYYRDHAAALELRDGFVELGWKAFEGVVMVLRGPSTKTVDTSRVRPTEESVLRAPRRVQMLGYPWCTPEVADQLLDARRYIPVRTDYFAVFEGEQPVSWAEVYLEDGNAQIEAVATEPEHRNRGHASAIVTHAIEYARAEGADFVFLVADAVDWPKDLYARLGFEEVGRYMKFLRT